MSRTQLLIIAAPAIVVLTPTGPLSAQSTAGAASVSSAATVAPSYRLALDAHAVAISPDSDADRYRVTMAPIASAPRADASETGGSVLGNGFRTVVGVGAGALVGGWLGYFGAQVANSDWDKVAPSEKTSLRQSYTAVGAGVGAVLGYFLRPKIHGASRLPQPYNVPVRTGRLLIASAELRRSIATNALEAIELDRPEWTRQQHADEAKEGKAPHTGPVESYSLVVYVGDEKMGALETLSDVAIPEVSELRYYDARDAKRRWGVDHRYGAIEVVPATSATAAAPDQVPAATSR